MNVIKLRECGYDEAVLGFSLSYNSSIERTKTILPRYAFGIPGENKFLESIYTWWDVTAPRYWWQEADTYRVGTTKQSQSTMHTLMKTPLTQGNFQEEIPEDILHELNILILEYKVSKEDKTKIFYKIKNLLPEGFLQRRIWGLNYKTLQNIYNQRKDHRLVLWGDFCKAVLEQVDHPEFIIPLDKS